MDVCVSRGLPQVMFHALRQTQLIAAGVTWSSSARGVATGDPTVFDKVDTTAASAIKLALTLDVGAR
jgi:hypothetical protein